MVRLKRERKYSGVDDDPYSLRNVVGLAADATSLYKNISDIFGGVVLAAGPTAAMLGIVSESFGSGFTALITPETMSLPIRLAIFLLIAAALGIGLAFATNKLILRPTEFRVLACYVLGLFWAGLMVGSADWLSQPDDRNTVFPELTLFTLIGVAIAAKGMGFMFRARAEQAGGARMVLVRSGVILAFATGVIVVFALASLEG